MRDGLGSCVDNHEQRCRSDRGWSSELFTTLQGSWLVEDLHKNDEIVGNCPNIMAIIDRISVSRNIHY